MAGLPKHSDRGNLIRIRRLQNSMTVSYLANRVGITETHMSGIERGERDASAEVLLKTARLLKFNRDDVDLLFISFGKFPPDVEAFLSHNPHKIIRLVRKILEKRKKPEA